MSVKIGVCEWAFPMWGKSAVRMAHEAGFQGVQLGDAGGIMHSDPLNDRRVQDYYLDAGAKYGIEFPQIHLYTMGHLCYYRYPMDSPEGLVAKEMVRKACIAASQMGVGSVIIDCMKLLDPAKYAHALEYARYALKCGEEYGVQIGMECDFTMQGHFDFIEASGGDLRLCFDTHNPCMYGTGYPPDMIRQLGPDRIDHFHVKDNRGDERGFVTYDTPLVPFGEGIANFREVCRAIKDIEYDGWVISENMYYQPDIKKDRDVVEAARQDADSLRRELNVK